MSQLKHKILDSINIKDLQALVDESVDKQLEEEGLSEVLPEVGFIQPEQEVVVESVAATHKPFSLSTEALSEDIKTAHMDLYRGYIKSFNRVSAELDTASRTGIDPNASEFKSLKDEELFNMNAIYLHELYFANISDVYSEIRHDTLAFMRLARDFGTFDDWQFDFMACAESAGEGWAVTVFSTYLQKFINVPVKSHCDNIPLGCYPVVVLDVHSHAYHHDYLNNRRVESVINYLKRKGIDFEI